MFVSAVVIRYSNCLLIYQGNIDSSVKTPAEVPSSLDGSLSVHNGLGLSEFEPRSGEFHPELLVPGTGNHTEIPLCQRLIAALISEEDSSSGNEDPVFDAYGVESDLDAEVESNGLNYQSQVNFQFAGNAASNGYRITGRDHDELEGGIRIPNRTISNFGHSQNGLLPDQAFLSGLACSEFQYGNMHINEKLLLEIQSIGIYPEPLVGLLLKELFNLFFFLSLLFCNLSQFACYLWGWGLFYYTTGTRAHTFRNPWVIFYA